MKLIPSSIQRRVASQGLLASDKAPKVLFVAGVASMVSSTVLACHATLKLEGVLDQIEGDRNAAKVAKDTVDAEDYQGKATYSDTEFRKDMTLITVKGLGGVVRLYAPSVVLGGLGVVCLTKSHNILQDRNLALAAAYSAVDSAFNRYRERVVDRYGEDVDRDLRFDSEQIDELDEETGKINSRISATGAPGSAYSRWYDEHSSRNWSKDPDINLLFLRQVQNYANDRLRSRGHIFLNEVYNELGLAHTRAGAIVGWRWNKESGDDYVDFGIWDGTREDVSDFFNGRDGAILLDFNVDGPIFDLIEESY